MVMEGIVGEEALVGMVETVGAEDQVIKVETEHMAERVGVGDQVGLVNILVATEGITVDMEGTRASFPDYLSAVS